MRKREVIAAMRLARNIHQTWTQLSPEELEVQGTREGIGGGVEWHEKWVRTYEAAIKYLTVKEASWPINES